MTETTKNNRILSIIAILLAVNVTIELYQILVPTAGASNTIDCKIVDISSNIYNELPIKISEIDSSLRHLPVQVKEWDSSDSVRVKVVDWDTSDEVKVKVTN
jgi:hypothetical protein